MSVLLADVLKELGWKLNAAHFVAGSCSLGDCNHFRADAQALFCHKHRDEFRTVRARLYAKDQHRKNKYGLVKKRLTYGGKPTKYAVSLKGKK